MTASGAISDDPPVCKARLPKSAATANSPSAAGERRPTRSHATFGPPLPSRWFGSGGGADSGGADNGDGDNGDGCGAAGEATCGRGGAVLGRAEDGPGTSVMWFLPRVKWDCAVAQFGDGALELDDHAEPVGFIRLGMNRAAMQLDDCAGEAEADTCAA